LDFTRKQQDVFTFLFLVLLSLGLYLTTFVNYLLFHSLVEIISIVVAISFFMITWNSRAYIKNQYLLFIGIAYLFIAVLDLLHTLSYKGMPIFVGYDYYANQLWIGARYMESVTLLVAFYFIATDKTFKPEVIFSIYTLLTTFLVLSIFQWNLFPVCFIEGSGLTAFKKISEYIICLVLLGSLLLLHKNRKRFGARIHALVFLSLVCTIVSELAFTFYVSNYGISNLVGHYFKLFSFYLVYKAIIETGIRTPYELIFKELNAVNKSLNNEMIARNKSEKAREKLITELQSALSEVKQLSGLIPLCSHCKKIRDDEGYWKQIEVYIQSHSEALFSHGICPECSDALYGGQDWYIKMKKKKLPKK
jgi:hypothetical protein